MHYVQNNQAKVLKLRCDGSRQSLLVQANLPLVRVGGGGLDDLRVDVFDASRSSNCRANVHSIEANYASAMMGGEPYAEWN